MPDIIRNRRLRFSGWSGGASTLVLNLLFTTATVASGTVTDVDGTGDALTYTGASHKRQWNADGVLEYAPHNLLDWSFYTEDFDNSTYWVPTRIVVTPSSDVPNPSIGGTVHKIVEDDTTGEHLLDTANAGRSAPTLKSGQRSTARIWLYFGSYTEFRFYSYSYNNLVVTYKSDETYVVVSGGTNPSVSITPDTVSGWYLVEITDQCTVAARQDMRIQPMVGGSSSYLGDGGTRSCYVAAAQVVLENTAPEYIKQPTATQGAMYAARVGTRNRKPVTNLNTYPEQFDNAVYTKLRTSVSGGQTDPFGGTNAFKLVENSENNTHLIYGNGNRTHVQNGKVYTVSFFASPSERNWIYVQFGLSPVPANTYGYFDLSNGVAGTVGAGFSSYAMAPVEGTNYYRVWATFTADEDGDIELLFGLSSGDTVISYTGDGSSGLYIFGAMLNEGGIEDYVGVTNLLTPYDKAFTGGWSPSGTTLTDNAAIAPDGTTTALHMVENSANSLHSAVLNTGVSVTANTLYNLSFFFKPGARTVCTARFDAGSGYFSNGASVYFDTVTGVATQIPAGWSTSMTYWGNGWWLCGLSSQHDATVNTRCSLGLADSTTGSTVGDFYTGDGTSDGYFWGAQLTKGSALYPYVGMQQTGFANAGYTAEAAATNLVTDSEDFGAAAWTINNTDSLTVTANQVAAPDGATTMDLIDITDTTNETKLISDSITISSATDYAISCFAKANEHRYGGINLFISSENFATVVYDLLAGTVVATDVGTTSGTVTASGVIPVGDGTYRIWASLRVTGTAATIGLAAFNSASPTFDASGLEAFAGTAGDGFYAWGGMVETGTYPSSYIATSGGTATRAADALSITDITGFFNPNAGTLVTDVFNINTAVTANVTAGAGFAQTSNPNSYHILGQSGGSAAMRLSVREGGTPDYATVTTGTMRLGNARQKFAIAYSLTDIAIASYLSAAAVSASYSNVTPPIANIDELAVLQAQGGTAENGSVKSLQYYSERKSNDDLATLSTITDDGTSWVYEQMAV